MTGILVTGHGRFAEGVLSAVELVAGVNMASIVQAVFMREHVPFGRLAAEVAEAGKQGVVDVSAMMEGME